MTSAALTEPLIAVAVTLHNVLVRIDFQRPDRALHERFHLRRPYVRSGQLFADESGNPQPRGFQTVAALRVLNEAQQAESLLTQKEGVLSGSIRISAPSDFGRQYLSPALLDFSRLHPGVTTSVYLGERVEDLIANRLDMSIRFGNLPDSTLVVRNIAPNYHVLVASGAYLESAGTPVSPDSLCDHRCLALELHGMVMNEWRFETEGVRQSVRVSPAMVSDDGALLRQWALNGVGIVCKSWWDVKKDVEQKRLHVLFAERFIGFSRYDGKDVGMQFVYPQRKLQPQQVSAFTVFFINWLSNE